MIQILEIHPTVFYKNTPYGLVNAIDIRISSDGQLPPAECLVKSPLGEVNTHLSAAPPGESWQRVFALPLEAEQEVHLEMYIDGEIVAGKGALFKSPRRWTAYLVHSSHLDLGYTDLPDQVLHEYDQYLDDALDYCQQTDDWPEDSRFHYQIEQALPLERYLANQPEAKVQAMVERLREGRIEVNALYANEITELCGHEEQVRLLYPAFRLAQRYGFQIKTAELNDIPGVSWGMASLLVGAGIRYFAPGIPDYFAWGMKVHPFWDEEKILRRNNKGAFWWQGVDGQRVLFWYEGGAIADLNLWTIDQTERDLPARLEELSSLGYPYATLRFKMLGGDRDNSPTVLRFCQIARAWNERWAYPRLIVSTNSAFFLAFEAEAGDHLPTLTGDLTNTDYPVGATCTPRETGLNRIAHERLPAVEKITAWAAMATDNPYPARKLREAYEHLMLYDEHTWGMAHPIGIAQAACWSQKSLHATTAAALAEDILSKNASRLVDQIDIQEDDYHLVVFNLAGHESDDIAWAPAAPPGTGSKPMYWNDEQPSRWVCGTAIGRDVTGLPAEILDRPFQLVDLSSGQSIPYQISTIGDPLAARPNAAERFALGHVDPSSLSVLNYDRAQQVDLVFRAGQVPPVGYKTYQLNPISEPPTFKTSLKKGDTWLENRYYRIEIDPRRGRIASIFDKELQLEMVDPGAAFGVNQLVARSPKSGECTGAEILRIGDGECGPVFASLAMTGQAPGCARLVQEIILFEGLKQIAFNNRILRDSAPLLELFFAFPFAFSRPRFKFEASNAIIRPVTDQLPGTNTNAYAVQGWVSIQDDLHQVIWSSQEAPVVALGGMWPGYVSQAHHGATSPGYGQPFLSSPDQLDQGHIYSYAMVNNFRTNFHPATPGDFLFRYTITSQPVDHANEKKPGFADYAAQFTAWLKGPQKAKDRQACLPLQASFFQTDAAGVELLAIKQAEDGDGLILRLAERSGKSTRAVIELPFLDLQQAWLTDPVERNKSEIPVSGSRISVDLPANGLVTLRIRGSYHSEP